MKVSGFTFLRNGQKLGYPFVASIRSILPIVDEFVVALGPCDDDTEKQCARNRRPQNPHHPDAMERTHPAGLQRERIRLWPAEIHRAVQLHRRLGVLSRSRRSRSRKRSAENPRGDGKASGRRARRGAGVRLSSLLRQCEHLAWSPGWYRSEVRIIRNTIPAWWAGRIVFHRAGRAQNAALSARRAHGRDDSSLRLGAQRSANEP